MGQLTYGMLDLMLHSSQDWALEQADEKFSKIDKYLTKILKPYRFDYGFDFKTIYRHFTHIFSSVYGYTCGYYSYFWADVIQAHLFEHYEKQLISGNVQDLTEYIREILAPGNAKDPAELVQNYCGGFDFDAFLRSYGLKE